MFRFLFRFAGLVVIALSFLFVVYDGTKSIADQTIYISRVGPTWANIHPHSLSAFEPAVEMLAGASVWNDVIQPYFPGATDCTRPSHHWCPPSPAWEQEEAAARLRAALRTVVSRVVSHIWFGLSGGGPSIYWELDVQVSFRRPRGPGNVRGRAAARLSAKHSDGLSRAPTMSSPAWIFCC